MVKMSVGGRQSAAPGNLLATDDGRIRLDLTAVRAFRLFPILSIQEMGHTAELFGSTLQGLNLFAQLGLFGLLLSEHFIDISHATAS